jgi:hypothetical protein
MPAVFTSRQRVLHGLKPPARTSLVTRCPARVCNQASPHTRQRLDPMQGQCSKRMFLARHADWEVGGEVAVMTATLDDVTKKRAEESAEQQAARELVAIAREQGPSLTGPDGLLKQLTKTVIETALSEEMTEHLGHPKHGEPVGGNIRNGTRAKTVLTDASGHLQIEVPRDRAGTFEPQIVKKRQRRLGGVDEVVLSLYAKGLTSGEISAHFAEIYGASVSKETISRITDRVLVCHRVSPPTGASRDRKRTAAPCGPVRHWLLLAAPAGGSRCVFAVPGLSPFCHRSVTVC